MKDSFALEVNRQERFVYFASELSREIDLLCENVLTKSYGNEKCKVRSTGSREILAYTQCFFMHTDAKASREIMSARLKDT